MTDRPLITIPLPHGAITARLFANDERFLAHVRDHFCNPAEPWDRIFTRTLLTRVCQNLDALPVSLLETLYQRVAHAFTKAAAFSAALPLYAIMHERVRAADGRQWNQHTVYCIAEEGFIMICSNTIVRTAYFCEDVPDTSAYTFFQRGWKDIKCRCAKKQYVDAKYATVHTRISVTMESAKNWRRCPNPHRPPFVSRRHSPRPPARSLAWCNPSWINDYDYEA